MLNMMKYKDRVWDLTESFDVFNLIPIPREQNEVANLLATLKANLLPISHIEWGKFTIESIPCPTILDNVENFQVF